jgi:RimJ/RimL family protein N-acetyltransferase
VGRVLMDAAEAWAREHKLEMLSLNVFAANERARRVYERLGYTPETLRYVKPL